MEIHRNPLVASLFAAGLAFSAGAVAADNASSARNDTNATSASSRSGGGNDSSARKQDEQWQRTHRASKIIGTDVQNRQGQKIGTVKDMIVDPGSGRVSHLVVAVGGVLGVGDKLFAVPYDAFETPSGQKHLVLNSDSALAHGFDDQHWSAVMDQRQTADNDRAYRTAESSSADTASGTPATAESSTPTPSETGAMTPAASSDNPTTSLGAQSESSAATPQQPSGNASNETATH